MVSTPNLGATLPTVEGSYNQWGTILNTIMQTLDRQAGTVVTIPNTSGNVTLDDDQNNSTRLVTTGTLVGNLLIKVKNDRARYWLVTNSTSGAFKTEVQCADGVGAKVEISQGKSAIVMTDGTDCVLIDLSTLAGELDNSSLPLAKFADLADMKVIGNVSGSSGTPQAVSILDEDDLASDSATALATQQSIKAYIAAFAAESDLGTVAGVADEIRTLADIEDGTVATNTIQTVAGVSADVTTVAGISSNITTVANNTTNINTVAGLNAEVATVAGDSADVQAVSANIVNINAVAANETNIDTVAGIAANVTTVAGDSPDIQTLSPISIDIQTLADIEDGTDATDAIQTVAGISTDVTSVAANSANINVVAANEADIDTVAGISSEVSALSAIEGDITTAATNIADITNFADVWLGPSPSDPATRDDGASLQTGDLYFNTSDSEVRVYNGAGWQPGVTSQNNDIRTPDLIAPADDATGTDLTPTLEAGVYRSLYGVAHAASQWQVATDSGFASLVHDQTTGAVTEWTVPSNLDTVTEYFWRVRYQDSEGTWSEWPDASSFTTADIYVAQPSVTAPADASVDIGETPTLTSSAFNVVNGSDTHASSDWEIRLSADDSLVWSSTGDTGNLEAITVPEGQLSVSTGYKARVRHTGDTFGTSAWSPYISFTTADAFTQVVGVALVTSGGGGGTWAHIDEAGNDFAANSTYFNQHPVFGGIVDETIDGQAMVKIPAFYYKVGTAPAGSDHAGETCWWVADGPFDGASLHPAFMLSSVEVDQFWIGKYQGTNDGGSKLGSQAGNTPLVDIDITQFRSRASARNVSGVSGFMLWSIYQLGAIKMLYLVEYANGDSQAAIGDGRVNQSSAAAVDAADVAQATYRGIVGLWGNVYQAVDGIEFTSSHEVQIWSDDGDRTLASTGVTTSSSDGWINGLHDEAGSGFDLGAAMIATATVGSEASSTYADYLYASDSAEQNVYFHGGNWSNGAYAGLFVANCTFESSYSGTGLGGRLARVI